MAVEPEKVPLVAALGFACMVGAAVLAWLSSPATLHMTRDEQGVVTASLESRTFGLITNQTERIEGIQSVSLVRNRTGRSRTPDHLVFRTANAVFDRGRNLQLFTPDYADIDTFFKDDASRSLTLSSVARGEELIRFFVAQAVFLFLLLLGLGVEWMVVRSLIT